MTQLTYNEAFDPYHCVFRMVRLHVACGIMRPIQFDTLRIMDFYLLFPFRLQNMKFAEGDRSWRRVSKSYLDRAPYGELPDDHSIFIRMEPFQRAAAASLVERGYLSPSAWDRNEISFTPARLPADLKERCEALNGGMADLIEILCALKEKYSLNGPGGLKDRTGLLEYRYDPR